MRLWYYKNGKLKKTTLPRKNNYVPKTKRLRKKKHWFKCGECRYWFKRYDQPSTATRVDGERICHTCLKAYIKKARPDLFDDETKEQSK